MTQLATWHCLEYRTIRANDKGAIKKEDTSGLSVNIYATLSRHPVSPPPPSLRGGYKASHFLVHLSSGLGFNTCGLDF